MLACNIITDISTPPSIYFAFRLNSVSQIFQELLQTSHTFIQCSTSVPNNIARDTVATILPKDILSLLS